MRAVDNFADCALAGFSQWRSLPMPNCVEDLQMLRLIKAFQKITD
jgi:hypothetical protein